MQEIKRILDKCLRSGARMAEIYNSTRRSVFVRVRNGEVETVKRSTPGGTAIRYFSFDRVAFGHTTDLSDSVVDKMIARLSRLAKKTGKQDYAILTEPQAMGADLDLYAPDYAEISLEGKIDYLRELEDLALKYDPLIKQSNGAWYSETVSTVTLVNSNGVELSFDDTEYRAGLDVIASNGDEMYPGEGWYSVRHFEDLPKPEEMVDEVAGKAIRLLGGTTIEPGDYEVILTGSGTRSLLWGLSFALNGEDFTKGSSFLSGREGETIADSKFSLFDDATILRGVSSRPFDDEGTASQKIALIENGVFKSALYDLTTAARAGKKSTGSSVRKDYFSFPSIGASNFYIAGGNDKFEDVLTSCKKGIVVEDTQGWGLNGITGQYSAGINGTLIRNGKRIKPVANITLAAGADDIFNGIGAVCDDLTFYNNFNSPSLMIKRMKVGA